MTPEQLASMKAQEDLDNWIQSCAEAQYASDLNQLTESIDDQHIYYKNMRAELVKRAKEMKCEFHKERKVWVDPVEFFGINDQQLADLQAFIDERGLDAKTVCEHLGIDALNQIEASKLAAVQQEIEQLAKETINA